MATAGRNEIIRKILTVPSPELMEAEKAFQNVHADISAWFTFKSLFYPFKLVFKSTPYIPKRDFILDSVNLEKFKRIIPLIKDHNAVLIHIPDLSTARAVSFRRSLGKVFQVVCEPMRFKDYFKMIPFILKHPPSQVAFYARSIQLLIRYGELIQSTSANTLFSANEDSWFAPLVVLLCNASKVRTINVMHGRAYDAKQFYDYSVVFGEASARKVSGLASPRTKLIRSFPSELEQIKVDRNCFSFSKRLVFFDQPFIPLYKPELQLTIYRELETLVEKESYEVWVKLHPAQVKPNTELFPHLKFIENKSVTEAISERGIGISVCSTAALEVIASSIPMIMINADNVLDHFLQIQFLKETSPPSVTEAVYMIRELQNAERFSHFLQRQKTLLLREYCVDKSSNSLPGLG